MINKIILILFLGFAFINGNAQETEPEVAPPADFKPVYPFLSIRASGNVPNVVTNQVYNKAFVGIYEINLNVDFKIYKGFYVGLGAKNALFSVSNRVQIIKTKLELNSYFLKLGLYAYHTERVYSHFAISGGYCFGKYTGIQSKQDLHPDPKFNSTYFEPELSINFMAEDNFSIGPVFSYVFQARAFDPKQVNLQEWASYTATLNSTQYTGIFNIGFNFFIGIGGKTKK